LTALQTKPAAFARFNLPAFSPLNSTLHHSPPLSALLFAPVHGFYEFVNVAICVTVKAKTASQAFAAVKTGNIITIIRCAIFDI
jgi:hypothetical protein